MTKNKRHMNRPFKTIRHLLLLLATAAAALCPGDVWADEISYLHQTGQLYSHAATAIVSTDGDLSLDAGTTSGYYYVSGDVTITGDLMFSGYLIFILCDDATLTVTGDIKAKVENSSLDFYAQSSGSNMGKLRAGNICKGDYTDVDCSFLGGDIVLTGGFDGRYFVFYSGHFTASSIQTSINCELMYNKATDWINVGTYTVYNDLKLQSTMMVNDDPNNTLSGVVEASAINGKKLSVPSGSITPISVATGITDGTVAINVSQVVFYEYVTATFTPATGYILTSASYTDDDGIHSASASDVANIRSSGRWNFRVSRNGTKSAFTVTATFAPIVASITSGGTTTNFPTLAEALGAVPKNLSTTTTIDVVRDIEESGTNFSFSGGGYYDTWDVTLKLNGKGVNFGNIANLQGSMSIEDLATGSKKSLSLGQLSMLGDLTVTNATVNCKYIYDWADNDEDHKIELDKSNVVCRNDGNLRSLNWGSRHIVLKNGSQLTLYDEVYLGHDNFEFEIQDNSWIAFNSCFATGYRPERLKEQIAANVKSGISIALDGDQFVTMTTGGDPSTTTHLLDLVLRGTWSLDLANSIPTYTSGESTYPKAVVQFYDGGTTAPTASTFAPSVYHPTGEDGANEITTVNNSDGADHYIIMHVAPTPNGGYWTDERLLYVMEGASAGARSRGPGISLNLPELLKRDLNDPSDPSQGYRYDGAGWYYYKLPASHCVANGYTKSTLYVEATRWFDLNDTDDSDGDKVVQDGKKITVPNHEGWTAEILLDEVTFEFDGAVKTPQITQIAFNNGSGTLFTLTDGFDNLLKVNGTKHIGLFPPKDECMIECVGTGWFNGTTPTATETTPAPVSYLVTVPLPVDDTSAERGTETNPWLVSTIAQMTLFGQCVDDGAYDFDGKYVRLTADLEYDATATNNYTPIGSGTPFAGTFFGTTDTGTPHVISGIRYAGTPALDKVGLFSQLGKNGGTGAVKDLQLKDCKFDASNLSFPSGFAGGALAASVMGTQISNVTVTSSKIIGADNVGAVTSVGGLAGNISQASTVSGCTVNGNTYVNSQVSNDLDNEEAYCQVGGIAGYAHGSEISGCTVDDCSIYSFHSGDNCPGNEVGGIVGSAPYGVRLLNNRVTGNTQFFDNIQSNNYSKIGAIYGNNYGTGGDTDISIGDVGYAIFMNNYYDISVDISYLNGSMSETKYIVGYMPRGTRVFTYNENPPYNLISVEFGDVTYGTVGYNNNDPADPIKDTNDAAKMYVKPATITLTAGTGRSLVFTETTTPKQADDTHPADCYAIDVDPIDGSPLTYYYAPGQFIPITVTYQQRTDDVRTFYDEVTITAKDGSAAQADVTLSPNGLPTPSGSATPSGITTYTQDFFFAMPADGVDVTADISESQWFTINTVNYNADDPSAPNAYNWMTFYHDWTDGTGTAATPANYKVTNYDNPLLDVEVMTVSRVNSADGWFALAEIDGGICYSGVPTIFHYAVANDATAVLPQKLKFTPVDPNDPQAPTGGYAEPTVAPQFQGVIDPAGKTLTADDKCYILNNAGDFILAYPTEGDDQIAAHKCYIDWNIEGNGNTPAPARLVLTGGNTGIERILLDGSSDGDWYSLDGRRLNGQPARKGIYINKGKKTVVK